MTAGTCFEWEDFRIAVDNICGGASRGLACVMDSAFGILPDLA